MLNNRVNFLGLGRRRAVIWAMVIALISIVALAYTFNPLIACLLIYLFGLVYGYYETVYFAISMRVTDIRIADSMFTILMAGGEYRYGHRFWISRFID